MYEPFLFCPSCGAPVTVKEVKAGEPHRPVCNQCSTVHYLSPKLAAGVVLLHDQKIVLTRRAIEPGIGLWSYPGGFVERGECVVDAARREAWEEVGAQVHLQGLLGVYSYPTSVTTIVIYRGLSVGEVPRISDEVLEVGLFTPQTIPWRELAFSSVKDALKDYIAWMS